MSRLNSKKSKAFHRLKHKNRLSFHFVCCLGLFTCCFIYVILVVGQGTIYALESLRNKNGYEFTEYREDEVIQLLGGPDDDSPAKTYVLGKRDLSSMERSLTKLLRMRRLMKVEVDYDENIAIEQQSKNRQCQRKRENATVDFGDETLFPSDLFTIEQRRHGAIILHFAGLVYMFIALAIVCDEFFVPSLGVITEALKISDDVAGATFMAAGGSAPEFFTSVFGVFITENNVGIGTIVGSATFNILCVLAFCCLFSKTVLHLTWWPLFRDMSFYVVALLFLVLFFHDEAIDWHEALAMFIIYIIYGFVMKYNTQIEFWVKSRLFKSRGTRTLVNENETTQATPESRRKSLGLSVDELSEPRKSIPVLHAGAMFRAGLAQMVLEEDDSIAEPASCPVTSRSEEQIESQPKVMNNGKTVLIGTAEPPKLSKTASFPAYHGTSGLMNGSKKQNGFSAKTNGLPPVEFQRSISKVLENTSEPKAVTISTNHESMPTISEVASFASPVSTMELEPESNGNSRMYPTLTSQLTIPQILDQEDEVDQPIDMSWPKAFRKQCVYVFLMPIMWPLYITLPDVKKPNRKKLVIVTFVGSVLWIAFYSYLMVWWANTIGVTLGIPTEVMGLTVLAAGTSIPDLITSVIVARKGLGDMAVSSSIGSNLFDICVGLPIPWLLFFASQKFSGTIYSPVVVISNGLICSVGMLFLMMVVLVAATAFAGWQMNKLYGIIMILSYIAFCIFSVFLEVGKFTCPLRVVSSNNC